MALYNCGPSNRVSAQLGLAQAPLRRPQQGEASTSPWRIKTYAYGPTEAQAQLAAAAAHAAKRSELRAAVSEYSVLGTVVLRLSRNLFEASTGGHEWGAGFCLAELLLSHPELVQGSDLSLISYGKIALVCGSSGGGELNEVCTEHGRAQANLSWSLDVALACWAS